MSHAPLRIATRGSALARWQAEWVAELLRATEGGSDVELVAISTTGDRQTAAPLSGLGTQGVFTREIQQAVLDDRADLAVHSLKDLPTDPVAGLVLAAVPARAPFEDVRLLPARTENDRSEPTPETAEPHAEALSALAAGARLGTGSLRRRAQLLWLRKDLHLCDVRGNVDTRLRKLDEGQYDALVLARAGLTRLGLQQRISQVLAPGQMLPAVGQGAVGVECRADDLESQSLLARIDHGRTHVAVLAERSLLAALRGGCQAPVGALAQFDGARLTLQAVVLSPDGSRRLAAADAVPMTQVDASGHLRETAEALGRRVGEELFRQGAAELIAMARAQPADWSQNG
jgi:hydroxymethylbilane synthase